MQVGESMKNVNLSLPPVHCDPDTRGLLAKKCLLRITKTRMAFWKTMTKTVMLRESRRPDMRDHTVDFGGDRATPRFGML